MLMYSRTLRLFGNFCLAEPALITFQTKQRSLLAPFFIGVVQTAAKLFATSIADRIKSVSYGTLGLRKDNGTCLLLIV